MSVEDEIRRRFAALANHIHDEVGRSLAAERDGFVELMDAERAAVSADVAREAGEASLREANERFDAALHVAEEQQAAVEARERARSQTLLRDIQAIDRAQSLSEILTTLLTAAAGDGSRAALLLAEGDRFRLWRSSGFNVPPDAPPTDWTMTESGHLVSSVPSEIDAMTVPLLVGGEVVAFLYAARPQDDATSASADEQRRLCLEVLARHAARALESVTAARMAQLFAPVQGWASRSETVKDRTEDQTEPHFEMGVPAGSIRGVGGIG